jgi:NAD+ synthetase
MIKITDYNKVFEILVDKTAQYVTTNNLKAMILGISGGIDSTVVAAICHEVSKRTGVPLIGRSLPTKYNKEGETTAADLVGKAFCNNYQKVNIEKTYQALMNDLYESECTLGFKEPQPTALTNGNIQARLRMMYLYNLAGMYKGLVMDTDNLTENNLGYFTIHGDVGDFNPIGGLWKTEVFELAAWLVFDYYKQYTFNDSEKDSKVFAKTKALMESIKLKPTAGLGITNNDLEEIGAESYDQVDRVLQCLTDKSISTDTIDDIPDTVLENIVKRHNASKFKRKQLPIKIDRVWLQ